MEAIDNIKLEERVAYLCGCSVDGIFSRSRRREIVNARKICMLTLREFTNATSEQIGDYFEKDRTSTIYLIKKAATHYRKEPIFARMVDEVYHLCAEGKLILPFHVVPDGINDPDSDMTEEEVYIMQLT